MKFLVVFLLLLAIFAYEAPYYDEYSEMEDYGNYGYTDDDELYGGPIPAAIEPAKSTEQNLVFDTTENNLFTPSTLVLGDDQNIYASIIPTPLLDSESQQIEIADELIPTTNIEAD